MKEQLATLLEPFGQSHLLDFWDQLSPPQRESLKNQIEGINFQQIKTLTLSCSEDETWAELAARATVPPAITLDDFSDSKLLAEATRIGGDAIAKGEVAMILVAGGQGSRLGFNHPKGMFPIGPISGRTLYQFHIEHLIARARQFNTTIPLYVMSSPPTHDETTKFLDEHSNFGLAENDLTIFCQGTMPAVDADGKLLLESKDRIFASPDGHGGTLAALVNHGCLAEMLDRGIKYLFYAQVDNPLVQVCNPALIGFHIKHESEMTSQVVRKTDPLQKVGNVVEVDGKVQIIEYSDLPDAYAKQTNADGSLKLWAGSIAVHVFNTQFLQSNVNSQDALPFHKANKKVPHIDQDGRSVDPDKPNAVKFERFIFDLLPSAKNAIVCEVDPAAGFCAVKNAAPAPSETPEHVKKAISDLHTKWIQQSGGVVAPGTPVEISPLYAVDAQQLAKKLPPHTEIDQATYLS